MNIGLGDVAPNSGDAIWMSRALMLPDDRAPARDTHDNSRPLGPISLTPPMPSITVPRGQVGPPPMTLACWVSKNPLLAVVAAGAVYLILGGGRRGQ